MLKSALRIAFSFALSSVAAVAQDGGLSFPDDPKGAITLRANDIDMTAPDQHLSIFVGPAEVCCKGRSPLSGRYSSIDDGVVFAPAFPLIEGQTYTALTRHSGTNRKTAFAIGGDDVAIPEVIAVYPGGPVVPENTLRFYISFASPMQPHVAEDFVTLTDDAGRPDRAAFMSFKQELWNADRTRLTLLMDPGRIKRGVAQNVEMGPALEQGQRYAITIKGGWPGALGGQTDADFTVPFKVGPPLRERPDPKQFEISTPRLNSREPLVIRFDRPFDRVQLRDALTVATPDGRKIDGLVQLSDGETSWTFVPRVPWSEPIVRVVIDARLEDVAGNNFRETLDHALNSEAVDVDMVSRTVSLSR